MREKKPYVLKGESHGMYMNVKRCISEVAECGRQPLTVGVNMNLRAENQVWQVNRQSRAEHPTGKGDEFPSLTPSRKACF